MAYTTMHGSVGMLINILFYHLLGPIPGIIVGSIVSFLSHLFGMDMYPDYYPDEKIESNKLGNWKEYYNKYGLWKTIYDHRALLFAIILILVVQGLLMLFPIVGFPMMFLVLFSGWFSANLIDFTEWPLAILFRVDKFWFVHWGEYPKFIPEWIKDFFRQHSKLEYNEAVKYELIINSILVVIVAFFIVI